MYTALFLLAAPLHATTPRWAFVEGMDNVNGGDWFRDENNDWSPNLNGTEAPFIEGLNAMYRATGDRMFLEEAVWHADGVMDQRNDARGVTDYTDEQTPCWRDMYYTGGTPYCWVGHSGAILASLLELAVLIQDSPYAEQPAWDGAPLSEHAQTYIDGAVETFDYHEDQWHAGGYYMIRADATFLGAEAGTPNPLNGSGFMARAALQLYDATGDERYLERATEIGARWFDNLVSTPEGGVAWPYYTDDIVDLGEDLGHASVSVLLAGAMWSRGILVEDELVERLAYDLSGMIYVDDQTMLSNLLGGSENNLNYQFSTHAWLPLTPLAPEIYASIRGLFAVSAPGEETTSGGIMRAWGLFAEHQPPVCGAEPGGGWSDDGGGWYSTAGEATLDVEPGADAPCLVALTLDAPASVTVEEDGAQVAIFQGAEDARIRYLLAEAATTFTLRSDEALGFQRVEYVPPAITSPAQVEARAGEPVEHVPEGTGVEPYWWALSDAPPEARIDPATGALDWSPDEPGLYAIAIRLDTDVGSAEQILTICADVECPEVEDTASADTADGADTAGAEDTGGLDSGAEPADVTEEPSEVERPEESTCSCESTSGAPWWFAALAFAALASRRRRLSAALVGLLMLDLVAGEGIAGSRQAVQISAGIAHTCALLDDGSVSCWGSDAHDQLAAPAGPFASIAAGWHHTCALDADGAVTCWGDAGHDQTAPAPIGFSQLEGAHVNGVGITDFGALTTWGSTSYLIASPPTGDSFSELACGKNHCCALDDAGEMSCWGSYGLTTAGEGSWSEVEAGALVTCGVDDEGAASCWGYTDYAPTFEGEQELSGLACGVRHCCGLEPDGAVSCWGADEPAGQLDAPEGSFAALAAGAYHTCALDDEGDVQCWGNDAVGQSEPPEDLSAP